MELSKRLHTVACAVTPGNRVADVGTDHGYLPIWLVEKDLIPGAIACDVRQGPLDRARAHIRERHLEHRIQTRLGSGLDPVSAEEIDTVVMAGMGGGLICRLLEEGQEFLRQGKEVILQPQSEWFKVRRMLHDKGCRIDREWMVFEDGHYYVIIRGLPGEEKYPGRWEYHYGKYLLDRKDPVLIDYLMAEEKKKRHIIEELEKGRSKKREAMRQAGSAGARKDGPHAGKGEKDHKKAVTDRAGLLREEAGRIRTYLQSVRAGR